jgi:hypothetical protein
LRATIDAQPLPDRSGVKSTKRLNGVMGPMSAGGLRNEFPRHTTLVDDPESSPAVRVCSLATVDDVVAADTAANTPSSVARRTRRLHAPSRLRSDAACARGTH